MPLFEKPSPPIKACVIGHPIDHSRSPLIHGFWLKEYGISGTYTRRDVRPEELIGFLRQLQYLGFEGMNVTLPHKEDVYEALKENCTPEAHGARAVNTVWVEEGRLYGTNTDIYGFMMQLDSHAPGWDMLSSPVAVLGAGGAARGILYGLLERGVRKIYLLNRTRERAEELAGSFNDLPFTGKVIVEDWDRRNQVLEGCGLLVNSTSLGMSGQPPLDIDLTGLRPEGVVADIVYSPLETDLLRTARLRSLRCVDGLGMLLHQAVPGFEKWFGKRPEVTDALREHVLADLVQ